METLATATSAISLISKAMLWSGGDPRKGLATSLNPLGRGCSGWGETRWTILSVIEESLGSKEEEEKTPLNFSPFLVVITALRP